MHDIDSLPLRYAATLFAGLPRESRTIIDIMGQPPPTTEEILLATIIDKLHIFMGGRNQESLVSILLGGRKYRNQIAKIKDPLVFDTEEEFAKEYMKIRKGA